MSGPGERKLTLIEQLVLRTLVAQPHRPRTCSAVAGATGLAYTSARRILMRLEQAGLATVEPQARTLPNERRFYKVTDEGCSIVAVATS